MFHVANAYEDGAHLVADCVCYPRMPDFGQVPERPRLRPDPRPRPSALARGADGRHRAPGRRVGACWHAQLTGLLEGLAPWCVSPLCLAWYTECQPPHPHMPRAQQQRSLPVRGLAGRPCSRAAAGPRGRPRRARRAGVRLGAQLLPGRGAAAAAAQRAVALRARPARRARGRAAPPVRPRAGVPRRPPALPRRAPAPGAAPVAHGSGRRGRAAHAQQAPGARDCVKDAAGCGASSGAMLACWRAACVTCMHACCGMHACARRHLQGRAYAKAHPSARPAWHA